MRIKLFFTLGLLLFSAGNGLLNGDDQEFLQRMKDLIAAGQPEKVEKYFQAIAWSPPAEICLLLAEAYLDRGQLEKARQWFERAAHLPGLDQVARAYAGRGNFNTAYDLFLRGAVSQHKARLVDETAVMLKASGKTDPDLYHRYVRLAWESYNNALLDLAGGWDHEFNINRRRVFRLWQGLERTQAEKSAQVPARILKRTAEYCRRLYRSVFHYVCDEEIVEEISAFRWHRHSPFNPWIKKREPRVYRYLYSYQIVNEEGRVNESRKVVRIGRKNISVTESDQETRSFLIEKTVFGPIALLAPDIQEDFFYRLLEVEQAGEENYYLVEALPLFQLRRDLIMGRVRIRERDGAVLSIDWHPRVISGFEKIQQQAQEFEARPLIVYRSEFGFEKEGLMFPSRVLIEDGYQDQNGEKAIASSIIISYKNYNFFRIESKVEDVQINQ